RNAARLKDDPDWRQWRREIHPVAGSRWQTTHHITRSRCSCSRQRCLSRLSSWCDVLGHGVVRAPRHSFSDGERRRVQLCMGLMSPWEVLLLDEVRPNTIEILILVVFMILLQKSS